MRPTTSVLAVLVLADCVYLLGSSAVSVGAPPSSPDQCFRSEQLACRVVSQQAADDGGSLPSSMLQSSTSPTVPVALHEAPLGQLEPSEAIHSELSPRSRPASGASYKYSEVDLSEAQPTANAQSLGGEHRPGPHERTGNFSAVSSDTTSIATSASVEPMATKHFEPQMLLLQVRDSLLSFRNTARVALGLGGTAGLATDVKREGATQTVQSQRQVVVLFVAAIGGFFVLVVIANLCFHRGDPSLKGGGANVRLSRAQSRPSTSRSANASSGTDRPDASTATGALGGPGAKDGWQAPLATSQQSLRSMSTMATTYLCPNLVVPAGRECLLVVPSRPPKIGEPFPVTDVGGTVVLNVVALGPSPSSSPNLAQLTQTRLFSRPASSISLLQSFCLKSRAGDVLASCRLASSTTGSADGLEYTFSKADGDFFAKLVRDMDLEDHYTLNTTPGGTDLHIWGAIRTQQINITDFSDRLLATTDSRNDNYHVRIAQYTDVGAVLCSLLCINNLRDPPVQRS